MEFVVRDFEYEGIKINSISLINVLEGDVLCDCHTIEEMECHLSSHFEYQDYFYDLIEECKDTFNIVKENNQYELFINFNTIEDRNIFLEKINSWLILNKLTNYE